MNIIKLFSQATGYSLFHTVGQPLLMPVSLAVSVTHRCNARCKTCRVFMKKRDELSILEYDRIFRSMGRSIEWVTITGGEPFMRKDLLEICNTIGKRLEPAAITVATNGYFTDRVSEFAERFLIANKNVKLVLNISMDAIGGTHDEMRSLEGCFENARETFYALRELSGNKNLHVGINTVVSKYNYEVVSDLIKYVEGLEPDAHIFEPAQRRAELGMQEQTLLPEDMESFYEVFEEIKKTRPKPGNGIIEHLIYSFRKEYYEIAMQILKKKKQVIPCYCGIVSAHISPEGNLWPCSRLAVSMGNLRDVDYDFPKLWRSSEAGQIRSFIKRGACYCPMANAAYTNIAMHGPSRFRIVTKYLGGKP